jgi:hypothetical protein
MDFSILILYFGTEREKMKRFCLSEKASNPLLMAHPQAVFWKRSEKNDIFYFDFFRAAFTIQNSSRGDFL